jgi:hypothetical protein
MLRLHQEIALFPLFSQLSVLLDVRYGRITPGKFGSCRRILDFAVILNVHTAGQWNSQPRPLIGQKQLFTAEVKLTHVQKHTKGKKSTINNVKYTANSWSMLLKITSRII